MSLITLIKEMYRGAMHWLPGEQVEVSDEEIALHGLDAPSMSVESATGVGEVQPFRSGDPVPKKVLVRDDAPVEEDKKD